VNLLAAGAVMAVSQAGLGLTTNVIVAAVMLFASMLGGAITNRTGAIWYHFGMAMTLRLDPRLEAELRLAAEEDHRSVHQTVVLAVETYLALRETAEVRADPEALRALAEARQAVQEGDVVYGTDAVRDLLKGRQAS
jgi:predicted transcriptional regulator